MKHIYACSCLILLCVASAVLAQRTAFQATDLALPADAIIVQGNIRTRFLQATDVITQRNCSAQVLKELLVNENVTTNTLTTKMLDIAALSVLRIESVDKTQPVTVTSNLKVNGNIVFAKPSKLSSSTQPPASLPEATAFIESMAVLSEVDADTQEAIAFARQSKLVFHDDFAHNASGWVWGDDNSSAQSHITHCGNDDYYMTINCQTNPTGTVSKVFTDLPKHSQIELSARVHFVDMWRGGAAFAKVDGDIVWLDSHGLSDDDASSSAAPSVNLCGQELGKDRLSVPIRVIIPHNRRSMNVTFGTSMFHFKDNNDGGKLKCAASLGVDDVAVYIH